MDTGLITIERTAMIPTRIARQLTPMLFSGSNKAERRFWEFFTANIRNPNTRLAYLTAAYRFADWCEVKGLALRAGRADAGCRLHRAADDGLRAGDRQAIPGGHPDAVRLARYRPGGALQSGQLGTRSPARCENRQDTGADGRGNPRPPRCDRHRHACRRYATAR